MPVYTYRAFDAAGKIVVGSVEASGPAEVMAQLRERRLSPLELDRDSAEPSTGVGWSGRGRVGRADVTRFTTQLASLLRARLPLARALAALREQAAKASMAELAGALATSVGEGESLSEAMQRFPDHFPPFYRSMVRAGEVGGVLDESLARLANILEQAEDLRSRLRAALTYPAIMLAVMTVSITIVLTFVIPRITEPLQDLGQQMPWQTRLVIALSEGLVTWWWAIGLALVAAVAWTVRQLRTDPGRARFDRLRLSAPLLGALTRDTALAKFNGTLGSLLRTDVPMLTALAAARDVTGNLEYTRALDTVVGEVKEGRPLSHALRDRPDLFPSLLVGMVGTGEESGNLAEMLENAGGYYDREAEERTATLTTMLEPAITVIMGLLVGFVIFSVMLPIFQMSSIGS